MTDFLIVVVFSAMAIVYSIDAAINSSHDPSNPLLAKAKVGMVGFSMFILAFRSFNDA